MKCGDFVYNKEIKEQFLATLPKEAGKNIRWRFSHISEVFEVSQQKDIAEASLQELRDGFSTFAFIDVNAARSVLTWFRAYNRWAHSTNQPFAFTDALEVFSERTDVDYTIGIHKYILPSPETLVSAITRLYPIDAGYEVLPALIFAWLGVPCSDAIRLKSDAADFARRQLTLLDGTVYPYEVPEAFWGPLMVYSKTRTATRFVNSEYPVFADDLGFFLKKMLPRDSKRQGKPYEVAQISANITDFCYRCEEQIHFRPTFNYTTIMKSGIFYRLYQFEVSGVDLYAKENKQKVLTIANKSSFKDVMTIYEAYRRVYYPRNK